jgi:hypothetical protein
MAVSSRERTSQQSLAIETETHWRASAVLSIASSTAGTKRTRSCSPTALPSPRQADNFLFFFELKTQIADGIKKELARKGAAPCKRPGSTPNPKSGSEIAIDTRRVLLDGQARGNNVGERQDLFSAPSIE